MSDLNDNIPKRVIWNMRHGEEGIMVKKRLIGISVGIGVIVVLLSAFVLKTLYEAGQFKSLIFHSDYICSAVKLAGPEDIVIDHENGLAFIGSFDRRASIRGEQASGGIYGYSLLADKPELVNLTADYAEQLHPHGIDLYISPSGERFLFVINMGGTGAYVGTTEGSTVEIFEYVDGKLHHLESITSSLITSPNDILGVGPRQFYLTNDHGLNDQLGKKIETYLKLPLSNIVYYDGKEMIKVVDNMVYANGLAMSADGKKVYATATTGKLIRIYNRDTNTGTLSKIKDIELDTCPDNVNCDIQGNLWVACLPRILSSNSYVSDASKVAPSQVIEIVLHDDDKYDIREVYLDNGHEISFCSAAGAFQDRLLIGSPYDDHFLDCSLKK